MNAAEVLDVGGEPRTCLREVQARVEGSKLNKSFNSCPVWK